jgi:long-chain acyl-CoA synthetase
MNERPWLAHYDAGVPAAISPQPRSVPENLAYSARTWPDAAALHYENRTTSYRELLREVESCARGLAALGAGPGTRIAIMLPNLPQTVIAYQAALRIGAQVVLTNPLYMDSEIEHQWNDSECTIAVVADFLYAQKLEALRSRVPIQHWIVTGVAEALAFPLSWIAPFVLARRTPPAWARVRAAAGVVRWRELLRAREGALPAPPGLDDLAVLQYTGGTTGSPKAALLTHRNLASNVLQIDAWFGARELGREVCLACLPLFHVFGMTVSMNWSLSIGAAIALVTDPRDLPRVMRAIQRRRVTLFPAVPALFQSINNHPRVSAFDLRSVKYCISGSAPLSVDVLQRFETLTGARIVEGYGLSETSPVTHVNPLLGSRRTGTIGVPVPSTDARIVDAADPTRVLDCGEEGELAVRGPQVMSGYWKRAEETAAVLRDGWFLTGDLAVTDADGYFRIVGRKKDMINVSGFKVYPDEIDKLLLKLPAVLEAATIGAARDGREIVKTYVVTKPGAQLSVDEVQAHCRAHLAPFKVPREVEFLSELPKSTVLKVLRRELRERDQLEQQRRRERGGPGAGPVAGPDPGAPTAGRTPS